MKVKVLSQKVICQNEKSIHNYFAWPTVARLHDGRLAMVASGFRLTHRCPFGKVVMCYSSDEGQTWSAPAAVIDTPLDDRDGGIVVYGENDVMITSFTNSITVQREWALADKDYPDYRTAYLDVVDRDPSWQRYLGSTFSVSHDGGNTFGNVKLIPVSSPHGPCVMQDGSLLYVGTRFDDPIIPREEGAEVCCYKIYPDETFEFLSEIEEIGEDFCSYEPHAIVLKSGKIIVHIRVETKQKTHFTIFQSESYDGGKTFTKPHQILTNTGGAPAHLMQMEDGTLISTYGYRRDPYGVRVMFSKDDGETWDTDHVLADNAANWDVGYPSTVPLKNGNMLTVYYGRLQEDGPALIQQVIWKYSEE